MHKITKRSNYQNYIKSITRIEFEFIVLFTNVFSGNSFFGWDYDFFPAVAVSVLLHWCTIDSNEKQLYATYLPSQKPPKWDEEDTLGTLLVKQGRTPKWCSLIDSYNWTRKCWPINKDLYISAMCGHSIPFEGPANSDGWQMAKERER